MPTVLADFIAAIDSIVKDDAPFLASTVALASTFKASAVENAVETYSKDKYLSSSVSVTGDGGKDYDLPTDWNETFSQITRVEYPAGQDPPQFLEQDDYILYRSAASGLILKFINWEPNSNQTFVVFYSLKHTVDGSSSTVYGTDFWAVAHLAASYTLRTMASKAAQSSESTIAADAVAYRDKAKQYTDLADKYHDIYLRKMGKHKDDLKQRKFASQTKDYDPKLQTGHTYLTHQSWRR